MYNHIHTHIHTQSMCSTLSTLGRRMVSGSREHSRTLRMSSSAIPLSTLFTRTAMSWRLNKLSASLGSRLAMFDLAADCVQWCENVN